MTAVARSRLRVADAIGLGLLGWRVRRLRAALTSLGIALGVAAVVAVAGITASSRTDALARIDRLGTGLLRVAAGPSMFGDETSLPEAARAMAGRIGPVEEVSATTTVGASVRRTDLVPVEQTGGIRVLTADVELLGVLRAELAAGRFLETADLRLPVTVLGATAAERLGVAAAHLPAVVDIGGQRFTVIGILDPVELDPGLDRAALIGGEIGEAWFGTDGSPETIYVRTSPDALDAVRAVLPATVKPDAPDEVEVSRPSDSLEARAVVDGSLTALLLALGAVALVVGGVGIANVMIVSVLERRTEIGLRRALGATRGHIRSQFLLEAVVHAMVGGATGVAGGVAVTVVAARVQSWDVAVPTQAWIGGFAVAVAVGVLAGVAPAVRAARLDPVAALHPA